MAFRPRNLLIATVGAISALLLMGKARAQEVSSPSEVKVTVVDQGGAVIADSEVAFKSDARTIVGHTGGDGPTMVKLPSGQYVVTASRPGFLKNVVLDFLVAAPAPSELKVVLKVDPAYSSLPMCGPCLGPTEQTPIITSDLPGVIEDQPNPVPPVQPATKNRKGRSRQCLYLWKCSTS